METWSNTVITGATTADSLVYTMPVAYVYGGGGGGAGGYLLSPSQALPAAPQGPLEWLDGEIERTCALARPKVPA